MSKVDIESNKMYEIAEHINVTWKMLYEDGDIEVDFDSIVLDDFMSEVFCRIDMDFEDGSFKVCISKGIPEYSFTSHGYHEVYSSMSITYLDTNALLDNFGKDFTKFLEYPIAKEVRQNSDNGK